MGGEIVGTDSFGQKSSELAGAFHEGLWLANCYFASHRLTISTYIKDAGNLLLQKASRP
jgi:hypothetical protein